MSTEIEASIPNPLLRSAPRAVRPTAAGAALLVVAAGLLAAAVVSGLWFYERAREDQRWTAEVVPVAGEVLELRRTRGENRRVRVTFRYEAAGRERTGSLTVRRSDESRFTVGSSIPLRYSAAQPDRAWIEDYGPNVTPIWLAMALPPSLLLPAGVLWLVYRRQARLLAEGRPAIATVAKARRFAGKAGSWIITYEWTLLSGARRCGRYQVEKNPPGVGSSLVIVYDGDNPKRSIRYPAPLARIA